MPSPMLTAETITTREREMGLSERQHDQTKRPDQTSSAHTRGLANKQLNYQLPVAVAEPMGGHGRQVAEPRDVPAGGLRPPGPFLGTCLAWGVLLRI